MGPDGWSAVAGFESLVKVVIELWVLSWRPSGLMEILLMNWTEPVDSVVVDAGGLEAAGLTELQLVASKKRVTINMVVFNIFSTLEDIGMANIAKKLPGCKGDLSGGTERSEGSERGGTRNAVPPKFIDEVHGDG